MNKVLKQSLPWLLLGYLCALNTSMAGMEIFAWTLVAAVLLRAVLTPEGRDLQIFRANRALNLWLLAMVIATALSLLVNPLYRPFLFQWGFMRWVVVLWALTLALQAVWSETFERRLLVLWMVLVGVTGLYAALQCLLGLDLVRYGAVEAQLGGVFRAVGWFSMSLTFAYNYGVNLFALSVPALSHPKLRPWAFLVCFLGGVGLVASVSRGAWLAGIFCVLFYLYLNRRLWVGPVALGFYGLSRLLILYSVGFGGKIEKMEGMELDHSSSVRLDLWRGYWHMFLDHPLFGVGIGQGDKFLPDYYERLGIDQEFTSHAHNNLLQFLGGAGILGLITYCGVNFIFLRKAWRLRRISAWGWSLFLAQLYMQLGGLTEANFVDGEVNHVLVFTWAILLLLEHRSKTDDAGRYTVSDLIRPQSS